MLLVTKEKCCLLELELSSPRDCDECFFVGDLLLADLEWENS